SLSHVRAPLLALLSLPFAPMHARADDPCAAFSWDVHHERDLFRGQPVDLASGRAFADAPPLTPDRLYELELRAQPEVRFSAPPSRTWPQEATYAGLARLTVETAGVYRIALDQPAWVDVVGGGAVLRSQDAQGRVGCSTPYKIVEFNLPAGKPLVLEFSASVTPSIRITVSRSPVQTP
ncbi:MAG TPA: hypothetical protein VH111_07870, partial [Steroidobacteraceae bacterium]|nr:hypothetical protein [Steroidobacteraceae bacterium]